MCRRAAKRNGGAASRGCIIQIRSYWKAMYFRIREGDPDSDLRSSRNTSQGRSGKWNRK
jgi:hypothetical protein